MLRYLERIEAYLKYHGTLYATFDGRHCLEAVVQRPFQCRFIAHIAGRCCNSDTLGL